MYRLNPLASNVVIEPIKAKDIRKYTGKELVDVETGAMDVLQYGTVVSDYSGPAFATGDVVLYEKLASHKTNFGEPRLVLVDVEHIHAKLMEIKDADQTS